MQHKRTLTAPSGGYTQARQATRATSAVCRGRMLQRYDREPGARQATPEARPEGYAAAGWRQHSSPGCAKERWERAQRSVATFPGQNVDMDKLHSGHADHTGHAGHGARSDGHSAHNYSVAHTHTSTQRTHSSRSPPKPKAHSVPHRLRAQQPRERPPYHVVHAVCAVLPIAQAYYRKEALRKKPWPSRAVK